MPEYDPLLTAYTKPVDILIRLTPSDTRFLLSRIQQAVAKETGVNLIFNAFRGAFSLVRTKEHGEELKCIGYGASGYRVESQMRGYNGPYSHVELTYPRESVDEMKEFLQRVNNRQLKLIKEA